MTKYENGISTYIVFRKMLSTDFIGFTSLKTTKAMTKAISSLVHRLIEMNGTSDHTMLKSIKEITKIDSLLFLIASNQLKVLLKSIIMPIKKIDRRKIWSSKLPDSISAPPAEWNQIPKGLLAITSIQIVGSHRARETSGVSFRSSINKKRTNAVQIISATEGPMLIITFLKYNYPCFSAFPILYFSQ